MDKHVLEITDIFRGAFFLCNGGDLCGIRMDGNGKKIATFLIRGEGLSRLDREYRSGQALVNPLQFRESLNHLRDILFKEIREDARLHHAGGVTTTRQGRRTRDDRKRKSRGVKAKH